MAIQDFSDFFHLTRSPAGKERPLYVIFLKYAVCLAIVMIFLASLTLICYGAAVIQPHIDINVTGEEAECVKKTWLVFLILNLVFCLMGLIGFVFEKIACAFFFNVYSFFVAFGAFFDTVSRNHWFLFLSVPVTLSSLILLVILRIERLDPPPPVRKYSIYTTVGGKA